MNLRLHINEQLPLKPMKKEHKWKIPVEDKESSCKYVTWANRH